MSIQFIGGLRANFLPLLYSYIYTNDCTRIHAISLPLHPHFLSLSPIAFISIFFTFLFFFPFRRFSRASRGTRGPPTPVTGVSGLSSRIGVRWTKYFILFYFLSYIPLSISQYFILSSLFFSQLSSQHNNFLPCLTPPNANYRTSKFTIDQIVKNQTNQTINEKKKKKYPN